jgi:hypothetical protein
MVNCNIGYLLCCSQCWLPAQMVIPATLSTVAPTATALGLQLHWTFDYNFCQTSSTALVANVRPVVGRAAPSLSLKIYVILLCTHAWHTAPGSILMVVAHLLGCTSTLPLPTSTQQPPSTQPIPLTQPPPRLGAGLALPYVCILGNPCLGLGVCHKLPCVCTPSATPASVLVEVMHFAVCVDTN